MKKGIHPKYYDDCKVTCTCGNTFVTGSTLPEIKVEICSACHPFFTGQAKYIDTEGRIEKFERKRAAAAKRKTKKKPQKVKAKTSSKTSSKKKSPKAKKKKK